MMDLIFFSDLLLGPQGQALSINKDGSISGGTTRYAVYDEIPCLFPEALSTESNAQQLHYEHIFQAYSENLQYPHTIAYTNYLDDALLSVSPYRGMGDMAEICCGTGEGIQLFRGKFQRAVGVDISLSMLKLGRKRIADDNVLFVQGDALHLPLASGSFDTVVMLGGVHHVPDSSGLFAEIGRILKPSGVFLAREPANDFFLWRALRAIVYRVSGALDAKTEHPVRQKEIEIALRQSNLGLESWTTHGFLGFCIFMNSDVLFVNRIFRYLPGITAITRAAAKLDAWCLSLPFLTHAGTQAIIVARHMSNPEK